MNTTELRFASNRVRDVERLFHKELDNQYGEGEVRSFLRLLFEAYLGWGQTELLMRRDETVNQSDLLRFHWAVEDLKRFRPIQHIIGHVDFCDCRIDVDSTTLIPRPETEEIVLNLFEKLADKPPRKVLDLCTGSGCIAIAIAKRWPEAEVSAVDVSSGALAEARHNAIVNNVEVAFMQKDILNYEGQDVFDIYDLIISNPPYIMESEKEDMQRNVLDWEPESALFVPNDDPLLFYRFIVKTAQSHLAPNGLLVLEINEKLGEEMTLLLSQKGFTHSIYKDFRGRQRYVMARRENKK